MRHLLFLLLSIVFVASFQHEAPGEPCVSDDIPDDGWPVYDYIVVGAGASSSVFASKLAELSGCSLNILLLEAGRSYTSAPMCVPGSVDCIVQTTENDYHNLPILFAPFATGSRSSWNYVARSQAYSNCLSYSNSETSSANCPYDTLDNIPTGCQCTSDRTNALSVTCAISQSCLNATGGNTVVCGTNACSPKLCAQNGTALYYRSHSKGGCNAHHAQITIKTTPAVAKKWVINSGDIRFQFSEWERSLKEMSDDWLKLSYVSNPYTPAFTSHNDTLKALLGDAINGLDQGYTDMRATSSNFIGRSEDFFNASNPDQPYFKGAFFDYFPGRQSSPEGYRSFPSHYIDRVMAQCGAEKFNASCNTYVTKLLFNNANKGRRAIGVEYIEGSDDVFELDFNYDKTASSSRPTKRAYARRGVILGGGTFESPHILMLNGIGDEKHLADFDIPVRKHLPAVGNNLADDQETVLHYVVTGSDPFAANSAAPGFANKANFIPHGVKLLWGMNPDAFDNITGLPLLPQSTTFTLCHSQAPAYGGRACLPGVVEDPAYLAHLKNETTFYRDSIQAVISVWTLFKSEQERLTRENPSCIAWVEQGIKFKSWWDLRYNYGAAAGSYIAIDVTGSNFGSRGTIRLKSNRSEDAPIIDTAPFSYSQDLTDHASCVNQVRKLISLANELSSINPSIYGNMQLTEAAYPFAPGASVPNDYYTEEIGQWIKDNVWHHHPQGTCQMGKQDTENSVVDSRGRVWGTQNLYVIDASAIAEPFDFFPSTSVMALGFLQAEAMWAKRVPDNAFCNPNDFLSAHDSTNYDVTPNSLEPAVIGLGVTTGVLGLVTLITISFIVFRSMSSPKGYTKIN